MNINELYGCSNSEELTLLYPKLPIFVTPEDSLGKEFKFVYEEILRKRIEAKQQRNSHDQP